jgi:hypothetical protein
VQNFDEDGEEIHNPKCIAEQSQITPSLVSKRCMLEYLARVVAELRRKASANLVAALKKLGFTVTNPSSLPTAFVATYTHGQGGRTFGFTSEYDALKDVGHGELS